MIIEDILAYAKSTGLFWPAAEIYGGSAGLYDYGHLGAGLKKNFEELWLSYFLKLDRNYHLIEGSTLLPEKPLISSGHAQRFNDIIVGCKKCKTYYRADALLANFNIDISEGASTDVIDKIIKENKISCLNCKGELMNAKQFNLMLDVNLGPEKSDKGYLRPETAQTAYLNFYREFNILRKKLPLGLAIIGRAYRNEISPRQGLYRMRELVQAELQIFFDPENWKKDVERFDNLKMHVDLANKKSGEFNAKELIEKHGIPNFYAYHMAVIFAFYTEMLKIPKEKFRFLEKGPEERAFYNKLHMDIEVNIGCLGGFKEVAGLHYRGEHDLTSHMNGSSQSMRVNIGGRKFIPNVLELSFGVDRNILMLIDEFYRKEGEREILKIPRNLAVYKIAVLGLQEDEKINEMTERVYESLAKDIKTYIDFSGSIGKRYARMDEIGTPYCITVDYESVDKDSPNYNTVTVRERDSKSQTRLRIDEIENFLNKNLDW